MRRRVVLWVAALIAVSLLAFAVPLTIAVRGILTDRALDQVVGEVEQGARIIDARATGCREVQLFVTQLASEEAIWSLWTAEGDLLAASDRRVPLRPEVRNSVAERQLVRDHSGGLLGAATPLATMVCALPIVLHQVRSDDALAAQIRGAWFVLSLVGAVVLLLSAAVAVWLSRRLAAPFEALAASARHLGEGDFTSRAPRSGLEEADAIADALDATADRLGRATQRSRAFTADASHQLRTPLTALRLHLESLQAREPHDAAPADALVEADRLEATIDELVALTQVEGTEQELDLPSFVEQRVAPWRVLGRERGRTLEVEFLPVPSIRARPAAVGQALQVLLDNAFEHGRGTVTVRISPVLPGEQDAGVRIAVIDEAPGIDPTVLQDRNERDRGGGPLPLRGGRGLALARSLIEAEGGRLVVDPAPGGGTRAQLLLPGDL